ncbi:MAG: hypothetical protein ACLQFW_15905 [Xanthobacteraceae bacterium]
MDRGPEEIFGPTSLIRHCKGVTQFELCPFSLRAKRQPKRLIVRFVIIENLRPMTIFGRHIDLSLASPSKHMLEMVYSVERRLNL